MRKRVGYVLVFLAVMLSGCAFSKMETAHQLEGGDILMSGTLDWPGMLYIPRANLNFMYGLGGVGDISAHVGTTMFTANAGLGGRVYLGDRLNLSLQGDAMYVIFDFDLGGSDRTAALLTATPRLTTTAGDGRFVYGGIQSNIIVGYESTPADGMSLEGLAILAGGLVGIDFFAEQTGLGVQTELIITPLLIGENGFEISTGPEAILLGQFSVGFYYRTPQDVIDERRLEPTRIDEERPGEEQGEPGHDGDGVPVY